MGIQFIKNREGDLIPFDITRIERAIEKASQAINQFDTSFVDEIAKKVLGKMKEILLNSEE
jgi:anaerobic ribonucleoside-triphosphate reductase